MPHLSNDPCQILIASDAWGSRLLLELCRPLTPEQFHQRFEIGLGTLHDTFTHIVSATRRWTDRLAGRTPRPMLLVLPDHPHLGADAKQRSIDELIALVNEAEADLKSVVRGDPSWLGGAVHVEWPGEPETPGGPPTVKAYSFSRAAVIVHLATHGYHHRAQILNMLRRLDVPGVSDRLPDPSAVDWQATVESPPVMKAAS